MVNTRLNTAKEVLREHQLEAWNAQFANFGFDFNQLTVPELIDVATELGISIVNFRGARPLKPDYLFFIELHYAQERVNRGTAPDHYLFPDFTAQKQHIPALRQILTQHGIRYCEGADGVEKPIGVARLAELQQAFADAIVDMRVERDFKVEDFPMAGMDRVLSCFSRMAVEGPPTHAAPTPRTNQSLFRMSSTPTSAPRQIAVDGDAANEPITPISRHAAPANQPPKPTRIFSAGTTRNLSPASPTPFAAQRVTFGSPSTLSTATPGKTSSQPIPAGARQGFAKYSSQDAASTASVNGHSKPAPPAIAKTQTPHPTQVHQSSTRAPASNSASHSAAPPPSRRKIDRWSTTTENAFEGIVACFSANDLVQALITSRDYRADLVEELTNSPSDAHADLPSSTRRLSPRKVEWLIHGAEDTAAKILADLEAWDIGAAVQKLDFFIEDLEGEL
ncbi:hypothetical protein LTR53_001001 [Teratosphaeriaceae sp. CCFEE 6253]|nr:hypothetical protein LTR53_001001 [Teratosphaeriaceae sp. CCFEE 6253]